MSNGIAISSTKFLEIPPPATIIVRILVSVSFELTYKNLGLVMGLEIGRLVKCAKKNGS